MQPDEKPASFDSIAQHPSVITEYVAPTPTKQPGSVKLAAELDVIAEKTKKQPKKWKSFKSTPRKRTTAVSTARPESDSVTDATETRKKSPVNYSSFRPKATGANDMLSYVKEYLDEYG